MTKCKFIAATTKLIKYNFTHNVSQKINFLCNYSLRHPQKQVTFPTINVLLERSKVGTIQHRFTPRQFYQLTQLSDGECSLYWSTAANEINSSHTTLWQCIQCIVGDVRFLKQSPQQDINKTDSSGPDMQTLASSISFVVPLMGLFSSPKW